MNPNLELIIFDWNGTALNDLSITHRSACTIFSYYGIIPPSFEAYRHDMLSDFMEFYFSHGVPRTATPEELNAIRKKFLSDHWASVDLHDGFIETVEECKDLGFKTAIVSGEISEILTRRLEQFDITHLFDYQQGEARDKTIALRSTLKQLKVKPKKAIYIDDSFDGLRCAKKVGMRSCGFTNGYAPATRIAEAQPDHTINTWAEFLPIIQGG